MSRMRLSTRLAPGLWLSQRVSCGECLFLAALIACPSLCFLTWVVAGLAQAFNRLAVDVISLWGR